MVKFDVEFVSNGCINCRSLVGDNWGKVSDEPNMTIPPIMINRTQRNNVKITATEGFLLALEMGLGESKTSY